jgi:DNA-directed RNA polymerase subunit omega
MLKPSLSQISTIYNDYLIVIAIAKRAREIDQEAENKNLILKDKSLTLAIKDFYEKNYVICCDSCNLENDNN